MRPGYQKLDTSLVGFNTVMNITSFEGASEGSSRSPSLCCSLSCALNLTDMFPLWKNFTSVTRRVISPSAADFFSLRTPQTLSVCVNPSRKSSGKRFNVPPSAEFVARVSGIPTMAKLPFQETADGLDAAFIGVPIDTGTSNRPGARCCSPPWKL